MVADEEDLTERTISIRRSAGPLPPLAPDTPAHLLLVLNENGPPRRIPLHLLPLTIGRVAPNDVLLDGTSVSRRHCRFDLQDGRILLTDLNSTNGTFVGDERISAPILLDDGAHISIGAHALIYHRRSRQEMAGWDALDREMQEANDYVLSILPPPISAGPVQVDWIYQPSTRLGGDAFGYQMLDERHFAAFLLDVTGHGTGAALHAVTVANVLRQRILPDVDFRDPAAVLGGLNRMFPMEQHNNLLFTIWYGVFDTDERSLAYATAGHHPAFLQAPGEIQPSPAGTRNPPIGVVPDRIIAAARTPVPAGSILHLFSDGVFEIVDRNGRECGLTDLLPLLPLMSAPGGPRRLYDAVRAIARPGPVEDDFSAIAFRLEG